MNNWKTTLAGLIGTLASAAANYSGPNTWQGYVASFAPLILGFLAKDFDTHSIVEQTQTATIKETDAALNAVNKQ
jgi:hypothetical protein